LKANEIQERRQHIVDLLKIHQTMRVSELVAILHISDETVRKDLRILTDQGMVTKDFGKVTLTSVPPLEPVNQRTTINAQAKQNLALKAITLLPEQPVTVALDQGSSVAQVARLLADRNDDIIITNSLLSMIALQNSHQQIYSAGGKYNVSDMSFQSDQPANMYTDSLFDFCFLGSSGVQGRPGICSSSFADAEMKRQMIANSQVSIVLVDATKFDQSSLIKVTDWQNIDYVVTDLAPTNPLYQEISYHTHLLSVN